MVEQRFNNLIRLEVGTIQNGIGGPPFGRIMQLPSFSCPFKGGVGTNILRTKWQTNHNNVGKTGLLHRLYTRLGQILGLALYEKSMSRN